MDQQAIPVPVPVDVSLIIRPRLRPKEDKPAEKVVLPPSKSNMKGRRAPAPPSAKLGQVQKKTVKVVKAKPKYVLKIQPRPMPITKRRLATSIDNTPQSRRKHGLPPLDVQDKNDDDEVTVIRQRQTKAKAKAKTLPKFITTWSSSPATNSTVPMPIQQSTSKQQAVASKKPTSTTKKVVKNQGPSKAGVCKMKASKAKKMWNSERYESELESQVLGSHNMGHCLPYDG